MSGARLVRIARHRSGRYREFARVFSPLTWRRASPGSREYARLFVAPRAVVYPYESMHWGPSPRIMGDPTLRTARLYREVGFEPLASWHDLPDHVALELTFMATLAATEAAHWASGRSRRARAVARIGRRFMDEHLQAWIPQFCRAVREASRQARFRQAAGRLARWLPRDHDWLLALTDGAP
jgi:TorA maturation chaperone TorD